MQQIMMFDIQSGAPNVNFRKIFLACLPLLEFSGAFFLAEIFEKVSFDPYNFRITRLSARKSEQMETF